MIDFLSVSQSDVVIVAGRLVFGLAVRSPVLGEIAGQSEPFTAHLARIRPLARVGAVMGL